MANDRFEIVSSGNVVQQTVNDILNTEATIAIFNIDILSNGYRIEWRENYDRFFTGREDYYRQNFDLNGANVSGVSAGVSGGSTTETANGLTYTVTEGTETTTSQDFTVYAEVAPSSIQGGVNMYADPGGSSLLDGTSNTEVVRLGGGNDTYYSSDNNTVLNGGEDTVFGDAGNDNAHLRNRDAATSEELFAGHFDGGAGDFDELYVNGSVDDYRIISHGDTLVFRHQGFDDRSELGRKIATAENIELFQGQDLKTLLIEDGFDLRATRPSGPAPTDIAAIRDYDGNDLGAGDDWKLIGDADVQYDNDAEWIYVNPTIGRWATVGPGDNGGINFGNNGQGGDTRVVGIYIDPLVQDGTVQADSDFDSQRRFQNDLFIDNLEIIDAFDFDADGFQEIYFRVTDGTAYLRALMHADGNIQYANYQNAQQVEDYLSGLGYDDGVINDIIG